MNLVWKLALRNLLRNQRRSIATGTAIAAGFLGLSLLGAYIYRLQTGLQANTIYINLQGHLQIYQKDSLKKFSTSPRRYIIHPELDAEIEKVLEKYRDQIEFRGQFLTSSGMVVAGTHSQPFAALAFDREILFKALYHPFVQTWGKMWIPKGDQKLSLEQLRKPDLISITPRMAEILGKKGDPSLLSEDERSVELVTLTLQKDMNAATAELGLTHTTGVSWSEENSMRMPLKMLQELLGTDGYQYSALFLKSNSTAQNLKQKLREDFAAKNLPLEVFHFTDDEIGEFYVGTMNFLYVIAGFFVILICAMVTLSIVNSLTLGILERTKELGTLKALGFSTEQIVQLFVRETVWLTIISILAGYVLSVFVAAVVNVSDMHFTPPGIDGNTPFLLAPNVALYGIFCLLLFGIAISTAYIVSKKKLKGTAMDLLNEVVV